MNDIKEATSQALTERIKSPFLGTFILVWIVLNWKFFAYLFMGDAPVSEKISLSESTLTIMHSLYIPLGAALIYTFIWPWISYLIEKYQSVIKYMSLAESVTQDHKIELQKLKNNLAKVRFETNEQHAIEKLLKSQGQFKKLLEAQKAFIAEADAILDEAEKRTNKVASFNHMLAMFNENYEEFLKREAEQEASADSQTRR